MNLLPFNKFYDHKIVRVLTHVLFWIAFFYLLMAKSFLKGEVRADFINSLSTWIPYVITFYLLAYIVFPKTIYKEKYVAFIIFFLLLFAIYLIIDYSSFWMRLHLFTRANENIYTIKYYERRIEGGLWKRFSSLGMQLTLFYELLYFIALPTVIKVSRDILQSHNKTSQLQKSNLQMELKFLKSQLNPHFLFNTLNNLDSLITLGRNKEASQITIRLAQFMRYTLYECNDDFISLGKEVELIKNYIELERIRHQDLQIKMDFQMGMKDRVIPPLLLLPFVENAFKHGADLGIRKVEINILLQDDEQGLVYIVENTTAAKDETEKGGIGLSNIKGRLQHYYPDRHELSIKEGNGNHYIRLKIDA